MAKQKQAKARDRTGTELELVYQRRWSGGEEWLDSGSCQRRGTRQVPSWSSCTKGGGGATGDVGENTRHRRDSIQCEYQQGLQLIAKRG